MKITLDHNCIIDIINNTPTGSILEEIVSDNCNQCFVVNIGASEMRQLGVAPDNYRRFQELLVAARLNHLPRINPMAIIGVTFFNHCIITDNKLINLANRIQEILFPLMSNVSLANQRINSSTSKKRLNRLCDIHTMWCHIHNGNDIFLTTDENFFKETKMIKLIALGAGQICRPSEL